MAGLSHFRKTRAKVQRLSDAASFTGWTVDATPSNAGIHFEAFVPLEQGDVVMFELFGAKKTLMGQGTVAAMMNTDVILTIRGEAKLINSVETLRVMVGHWKVNATADESIEVRAVDASPEGLGFVLDKEVTKGTRYKLVIQSEAGPVSCIGEVRYCRRTKSKFVEYRVGLQLDFDDRIERARWLSNFDLAA